MDWPKAKNILITGFLLLNLYLAYLLFYLPESPIQVGQLDAEAVQALRVLSKHYQVDLEAVPEPLAVKALPALKLAPATLTEEEAQSTAFAWLGQEAELVLKEEGKASWHFQADGKQLRVAISSSETYVQLEYRDTTIKDLALSGTSQEAVELAGDFLNQHLEADALGKYSPSVAIRDPLHHGYIVEFNRLERGIPIFGDSYRLLVSSGQVVSFVSKQSNIEQAFGKRLPLVTADFVVKRFLAQLREPRSDVLSILDLRLGYDLVPNQPGQLQPVWRMMTTETTQEEVIMPAGRWYWEGGGR